MNVEPYTARRRFYPRRTTTWLHFQPTSSRCLAMKRRCKAGTGVVERCWNLSVSFTTRYFRPRSHGTETGREREREKEWEKAPGGTDESYIAFIAKWSSSKRLFSVFSGNWATLDGGLSSLPKRFWRRRYETTNLIPFHSGTRPLFLSHRYPDHPAWVPPFRPRPTLRLIHEYCMTIVEIFIVRSRSEEENRLSEQAVVSNELVGRKLSFARSNLLGPWLNRRLPAGSGRTPLFPFSFFSSSSLSLSLSVCLSLSLSLSLSFWLFSFFRFFFSAFFSPFSHLCLDGGARGFYERSWGAGYFYWFSRNVGVENISTTYARWIVYSWSVN